MLRTQLLPGYFRLKVDCLTMEMAIIRGSSLVSEFTRYMAEFVKAGSLSVPGCRLK
jgi:hypothetical protein